MEEQIIQLIKDTPAISRSELAKVLGKSKTTIYKYTSKLKNAGRIKRVGGDKGGRWEVMQVKN